MEAHETLKQYTVSEANQNQVVQLAESAPKSESSAPTEGPLLIWFLPALGGIVALAIVAASLKQLLARRRKPNHPKDCFYDQQIPCSNCRFSNQNFYLKCAVHPTKAMQKEAIGCSDYWAKDSNTFYH